MTGLRLHFGAESHAYLGGGGFSESLGLQHLVEVAVGSILGDEIDAVLVLEAVEQADNVGMAADGQEVRNLALDLSNAACLERHLVNDLDGHHQESRRSSSSEVDRACCTAAKWTTNLEICCAG